MEEIEYLCVWAWKRRGGWAGGVLGTMTRLKQWEYRSIVIVEHTLSYYEMGTEDSETPRGSIDLWTDQASFHIDVPEKTDNAPTPHQITIRAKIVDKTPASSTVDAVASPATTTDVEWKLCFDQQDDLMRLVSVINRILDQGGAFQQKDIDRFEHQFVRGDHIYRWEMIVCPPVIYPIQIHAIVLEAGRNCLVVVDFGLTGYAKKKDAHFHHAEDNDEAVQQQILAAFRKLRPTDSTQRLNILTLTDQTEIRKWFKAGYDEESMLAKAKAASGHHHIPLDKIGKMFKKRDGATRKRLDSTDSSRSSPSKELRFYRTDAEVEQESQAKERNGGDTPKGSPSLGDKRDSIHSVSSSDGNQEIPQPPSTEDQEDDAEKARRQSAKQLEALPHSDPVDIVLARANFCLENMHLLPPYHVFFSNSECIAVWCKTGRWSTLQTAVWCSTNSVGAFKTSTLTTIGVAAANPLLAPVIAIGGLLWVSAPMLILQKSRAVWEEHTRTMTDLFWDSAPPMVFVSAIENWTTILRLEGEVKVASPTSPATRKTEAKKPQSMIVLSMEESPEKMTPHESTEKDAEPKETKVDEEEKKAPDDEFHNGDDDIGTSTFAISETLAEAFSLDDDEETVKKTPLDASRDVVEKTVEKATEATDTAASVVVENGQEAEASYATHQDTIDADVEETFENTPVDTSLDVVQKFVEKTFEATNTAAAAMVDNQFDASLDAIEKTVEDAVEATDTAAAAAAAADENGNETNCATHQDDVDTTVSKTEDIKPKKFRILNRIPTPETPAPETSAPAVQ